jgi:hypothetical protein
MSDNIDIPVTASGDDDVNRVTSAIDRLTAAMERLGSNSALERLAQQMEMMQATMVTGFANLAATADKTLQALAGRQAAAIEEGAAKATAAIEAAGLKIKAADARTWEQIQRGSAANVTAAFAQLAEGIPIETVLSRYGELATGTALAFDGQVAQLNHYQGEMAAALEKGVDRQLEVDRVFAQASTDLAAKAAAERQAIVERRDVEEYRMREAASAELQALIERRDLEEYKIRSEASARLQALIERRDLEEYQARSAAAQRILEIEQRRDLELYTMRSSEAQRLAEIQQRRDMEEYAAAQTAAQRMIEIEQKRDLELHSMRTSAAADVAAQAERQRTLNTNYLTASPAAQVRTATQAQTYASLGGDAAARYGSAAAGADALAAAEARLAASSRGAAAAQLEMSDVLRQAEGAFRGAAHEAGIYGLHHGQLIALLAGGALAAGLHHVAETGAEVEFQLKSLNALNDDMSPVDLNKFVGITSGTLTNLKDAAEGMHALAQAGQTQAQAFSVLPDIMRLASLGEMSVAQAAEMAVETMHAFGLSINDVGHIGDVLVAVGSKANVSVRTLAEDMKSAATTGEIFGMSVEEINATVGTLAERGLTMQPLSSALMKLYEPSDKTAKVIKQLGIEVGDAATGKFRPFTDIITDLSNKLNTFSDKGATDTLKQMGFSSRDIKAMQAMTAHLDDYIHLLHEAENAHGKMFDAMTSKEDTVMGAWERLGSTVQGTFVKGFEEARPAIQQVTNDLMHMAGSDGAVTAVANLAAGFARLAGFVVENTGTIAAFLGVMGGLRVMTSIAAMVTTYELAQRRATIATEMQTTALGALAVEEGVAAGGAAALSAETAVLETRMEAAAVGARLASASLGWITLAVTAAVTAYQLLSSHLSEAESKHQSAVNTANTVIDAYQREIDRLKEMNYQLEHVGENAKNAGMNLQLVSLNMEKAKAQLDLQSFDDKMAAYKAGKGSNPVGWMGPSRSDLAAKVNEIDGAIGKIQQLKKAMSAEESRNSLLTDSKAISEALNKIPLTEEMSTKLGIKDPAVVAALQARRREIQFTTVDEQNHAAVLEKVKQLNEDINAAKQPGLKPQPSDKDGARAAIEQLQERLRLEQMLSKSRLDDAKSENKRGELGDLQLINKTRNENLALHQKAVDIAEAERAAAGPLKPGQQEKYNSRVKSAKQQLVDDKATAARAIADTIDKMDTQELQARAKALESKGQLEDAYNLTWQAKNAKLMANLANDIEDAENAQYRDRLVRFQRFMEDQRRLGANDARFKEGEQAFGNASSALDLRLNTVQQQYGGPGTGLGDQLAGFEAQRTAYAEMIPQMQAAQNRVASASSSLFGDNPAKLKAAQDELRAIQDRMAAMRNIGVNMADAIGKALADAFGQGGAALGGMLTTAMSYDARIQAIKDKQAKDGDTKAAAEATASAQIKAYGDMAGAAKGFFDTNSNGYKILTKTEQAFRVLELAGAAANFAKKMFFKTTEVTTTIAGDGAKMASGTAATAVDVANASASGTAWGIAAVAKAIASLTFPLNLVAGAATMAALVAVGVKMTGGFNGGGQTEAQKQQANATGTVLGDPDTKSESNAKSLALVEKNTYNNLVIAQGMLSSLRSIDTNIKGFVAQLFKVGAVDGSGLDLSASSGAHASGLTRGAIGAVGYMAGEGLTAFTSLATLGGPLGMGIALLATKIPVLNNLIGKVSNAIFGGKQSIDASGFTMSATTLSQLAAGGANAQSYADVTTSGGWFRGDSHKTATEALGADANRQITTVITGMGDAIAAAAGLLGENGADFKDKLNGFVIDIGKIDLKGLSSADAQAKVAAVFSKLGDQMAQAAFGGLEQFQQAGEGYLETLTRVANDYATIDTVFKSFGATYAEVGTASIAAREQLIDMAGGLDKFTSQASWFFQNMLTKAQQTAATSASINPILSKYGLSTQGADAVQKFTDLTVAMGAMGSAGATAYTELMSIAQAFKSVTDVASDLQKQIDDLTLSQAEKDAAARAQLDPSNQGLYDELVKARAVAQAKQQLLSAYQSESSAIQSTIDRLKSLSLSLRNFVNGLQIGNMSPLNPADQYGAARSQFEETLAKAQGGDITAQGNLQSAAQAFLTASKTANASNSTYQSDFQRVVSTMTGMADKTDGQVKTAQSSLTILNQQVTQLVAIDTSVTSVASAINNLAVVLSNGKNQGTNVVALTSAYKELFNRAPDAAGLAFWEKQLESGVSLSDIIAAMKNSTEYIDKTSTTSPTTVVTPSTNTGTAIGSVNTTSNTAAIDALYQNLLGRQEDQAGLDYWLNQMKNGVTISAISDAIKSSTEYINHLQQTTGTMSSTSSRIAAAPALAVTTDPYAAATAQTAAIVSQLTTLNKQVTAMRGEQQTQADNQSAATMQAGANTAEKVADSVTIAAQKSAWAAQSAVALR